MPTEVCKSGAWSCLLRPVCKPWLALWREVRIITLRRISNDGATLEHLGAKLGISKERVRQLETRAMNKLKSALIQSNENLAREAASS